MGNFKSSYLGIILLGVVSSLIAAFIWAHRSELFPPALPAAVTNAQPTPVEPTTNERKPRYTSSPHDNEEATTPASGAKPSDGSSLYIDGSATQGQGAPSEATDPASEAISPKPALESPNEMPYAHFSSPILSRNKMNITPLYGFAFNDRFPDMFGGTWRITVLGGGFTGTFSVPTEGEYNLVVTHGSSYDDMRHRPSYSPVTIQENSQIIASYYSPPDLENGGIRTDRWPIFARAGQNTLQWNLGRNATTHYWIQKIEITQSVH